MATKQPRVSAYDKTLSFLDQAVQEAEAEAERLRQEWLATWWEAYDQMDETEEEENEPCCGWHTVEQGGYL